MSNEDELCEMVISHLEQRQGALRGPVRYPERDGIGPPVERRVQIGSVHYAIEHTLVEPFEGHIRSTLEFEAFCRPMRETLDRTMPPPGNYKLHFALPLPQIHRRDHHRVRQDITAWVKLAAAELHAEAPARQSRERAPYGVKLERRTEIAGISMQLMRHVTWAQSGNHDGRLFFVRVLQEDLEQLRLARIGRAIESKCPKLAACKSLGDVSVLVLEMQDFVLSNEELITVAAEEKLRARVDRPDLVLLADTTIEGDWELLDLVL